MARADPGATWGERTRMQLVIEFLARQHTARIPRACARCRRSISVGLSAGAKF
jgi:hypothetical protein